ncbi:MAG: hypothetical protein NTW10_00265 [Bacteroidetes bacterium]|nr:hypothetical protein [Bacteroidota bacterium]
MTNTKSFLPDLKELGLLMLGFLPWMLFLFISGHTMMSLKIAVIISLVTTVTLGFGDLKRGFILTWGTFVFFIVCLITINLLNDTWMARQMDLLSNLGLAAIMWFTLAIGKPFALQYAKRGMPEEKWNNPKFIRGCMLITLVWACLMTFAAFLSVIRRTGWVPLPGWVYFDLSLLNIAAGLVFTTVFKRRKRLQREAA